MKWESNLGCSTNSAKMMHLSRNNHLQIHEQNFMVEDENNNKNKNNNNNNDYDNNNNGKNYEYNMHNNNHNGENQPRAPWC